MMSNIKSARSGELKTQQQRKLTSVYAMSITVVAKCQAVSAEAAEKIAAALNAEGAKFAQEGVDFTVTRIFADADAVKGGSHLLQTQLTVAYSESEAYVKQKELATTLVVGGPEGFVIEKS